MPRPVMDVREAVQDEPDGLAGTASTIAMLWLAMQEGATRVAVIERLAQANIRDEEPKEKR